MDKFIMVCLCSLLEKTKHKQVQSLISKCVQTHYGSQSLFFYVSKCEQVHYGSISFFYRDHSI